jgi:hypothetical protein
MSVSHETTETSSVFWTFPFGNSHSVPPEPPSDLPIIVSQVPGLTGEAHQVDVRKGRELVVEACYSNYANLAALLTAFRLDQAKAGNLLGELLINSITYGNATFLGVAMTRSPQVDGKNSLWFVDAVLRWRLRT